MSYVYVGIIRHSLLTVTISKGQRRGQSGYNECFLRFMVCRGRVKLHHGHETPSGNPRAPGTHLVEQVNLSDEMFDLFLTCPVLHPMMPR